MLAIRPRKASNKWEDRKWQHPARELAVWESLRLMTSPARPWGGASGRSNAGSAPERIRSSDPPSATPAKSRSRWQRERWVALRPVLASWTCFSLSGSAGRPATLTLFPLTSPSILSPDLDIRGVRFKARWTERFFSPMIVVMQRS